MSRAVHDETAAPSLADDGLAADALADAVAARADALTARALRAMYANPFWEARYGERGRRFAAEDGRHHVAYLVEALRAGSPDALASYARWLQSVLVARGMCSRHLGEHFARLADALRAEAVPGVGPALTYLAAAEHALLYEGHDAARAIQESVEGPFAAAEPHPGPAGARYLASYLADAVALGRPAVLAAYVRWTAAYLAPGDAGRPRVAHLAQQLLVVDARVRTLPPAVQAASRPAMEAAMEAALEAAWTAAPAGAPAGAPVDASP